jgi:hypothetical protein
MARKQEKKDFFVLKLRSVLSGGVEILYEST